MILSLVSPKIRRGLHAAAALVALSWASSAQAAPILFDITGSGGPGVLVSTFDELPGNALAVGAQALINATPVGGTTGPFDLLYQANVRLIDPNGNTIATPGFTLTAVAKFRETATVLAPGVVTFNLAADQTGSYFNFYAKSTGGNNATGVGFSNDTPGTLIYSAAPGNSGSSGSFINTPVPPGENSNLDQTVNNPAGTGQQTIYGAGGATITVFTTYFNSSYFVQDPGASTTFNTNNNLPFRDVSPAGQFAMNSGSGAGSTFTG